MQSLLKCDTRSTSEGILNEYLTYTKTCNGQPINRTGGQISVLFIPDKCDINSATPKGWRDWMAWREIRTKIPESGACDSRHLPRLRSARLFSRLLRKNDFSSKRKLLSLRGEVSWKPRLGASTSKHPNEDQKKLQIQRSSHYLPSLNENLYSKNDVYTIMRRQFAGNTYVNQVK